MVVCERHAKTDHPNCYTLGIGGFLQSGPGLLQDMLMVSMMLLPTRWDRVEESGLRKPNPVQKPSDVACEMRMERSSCYMPAASCKIPSHTANCISIHGYLFQTRVCHAQTPAQCSPERRHHRPPRLRLPLCHCPRPHYRLRLCHRRPWP